MTLGRIAYRGWYQPLAACRQSWREGGPIAQWITRRGRRQMLAAVDALPPLDAAPGDAPEVSFLTGRRFWYQTAFCFWSLARQAGRPIRAAFADDGSLDGRLREACLRLFPGSAIASLEEIEARLDEHLPESRFPTLRARRREYPNLRKLTDVHAGRHGWRLVLDSDMLFFRRPDLLLAWLAAPDRPLHMIDVHDAYGYPPALLESLAGAPVPHRLNVGICGLNSDEIDWARLEFWCRRLQEAAGTSYYQEQALVALMLTGRACRIAPAADYRLMPADAEARRPSAIMHHYVDLSKRGYFRHAWRRVVESAIPA